MQNASGFIMETTPPAEHAAESPAEPDFTSEPTLVTALQSGDDQAYEYLVKTYLGRMLAVARRIVHNEDDARDAVQEAFLSAFKAISKFSGDSKVSTWLHRIVVNACLMKLRSARRHPTHQIDELLPKFLDDGHRIVQNDDWNQTPVDALSKKETAQAVRDAIEQLPDTHRTVLLLRDIEQLDTAETASMLGVTVGVVKTRLHRARLALRELIAPTMADGGAV
jgi:RNA polymerase sigma-70 factor (ECF subfamily)